MAALCDTRADIVSCRRFYIIIIIYYIALAHIRQEVFDRFHCFFTLCTKKGARRAPFLSVCTTASALIGLVFAVFLFVLPCGAIKFALRAAAGASFSAFFCADQRKDQNGDHRTHQQKYDQSSKPGRHHSPLCTATGAFFALRTGRTSK